MWLAVSRFGSLQAGCAGRCRRSVGRWHATTAATGIGRIEPPGRRGSGLAVPRCASWPPTRRCVPKVEDKLAVRWLPWQISGWSQRTYPGIEEIQVSYETIYLTFFIQARGGLKRELTQHLRSRRANRRPKGTKPPSGKGQIVDPVMISQGPAEVEDRAVPGHWQGDLLMGKRPTAFGTLVERSSRFVMLFPLPDGHISDAVRDALAETVQRCRSICRSR